MDNLLIVTDIHPSRLCADIHPPGKGYGWISVTNKTQVTSPTPEDLLIVTDIHPSRLCADIHPPGKGYGWISVTNKGCVSVTHTRGFVPGVGGYTSAKMGCRYISATIRQRHIYRW
jgi:hypothetical protein